MAASVDVLAFLGMQSGVVLPSEAVVPTLGATALAVLCMYLVFRLVQSGVGVLSGEGPLSASKNAVAVLHAIGTYVPPDKVTPDYFMNVVSYLDSFPCRRDETVWKARVWVLLNDLFNVEFLLFLRFLRVLLFFFFFFSLLKQMTQATNKKTGVTQV